MSTVVKQKPASIITTLAAVSITFALFVFVLLLNPEHTPKERLLFFIIGGVGVINDGYLLLFETYEYHITQAGIAKRGLFGKVTIKKFLWSDFVFIGILDLKARWRGDIEGKVIVCATYYPQKRFSNGTQYVLGDRGVLKFEYDPELFETIMKLKNSKGSR